MIKSFVERATAKKMTTAKGVAIADANCDGKRDYFCSCTSGKGVHLTLSSGKPLVVKRILQRYHYASYAKEPDCKEKNTSK